MGAAGDICPCVPCLLYIKEIVGMQYIVTSSRFTLLNRGTIIFIIIVNAVPHPHPSQLTAASRRLLLLGPHLLLSLLNFLLTALVLAARKEAKTASVSTFLRLAGW
jgi:hypothetical protein